MRGIELDQLRYLTNCRTAAEMWSKLKTVHAEKSDQSSQVLLEKFINCKIAEGEIMADYIARIMSMADRLKDMDLEQKPAMIIAKILSSLPQKYDNIRTSWYAVSRSEQTLERLTDHLINEESLIKIRNGPGIPDKTAFIIHKKRRNNYRSQNHIQSQSHQQGHSESHLQSQSQCQTKQHHVRRSGTCNYCNKLGHWARECYKKKYDQQIKKQNMHSNHIDYSGHSLILQRMQEQINQLQQHQQQQQCSANAQTADLFVIHSAENKDKVYDQWFADSGATDHMTFQKEYFKTFKLFAENSCFVRVGDGRRLIVQGVGDVEVQVVNQHNLIKSNFIYTIKDVLYIPELERNFISVISATEKGIEVVFREGGKHVSFIKNNSIIVDGIRENKLYKMNLVAIKRSELNVVSSLRIWHERFGHANFRTLKEMSLKGTVNNMKTNNMEDNLFCEGCAYGKQHRTSFPKDCAIRAFKAGEIIHIDLCGKMNTSSIGGANYFMLCKDDFSRYCFVYFLKSKTGVLEKLKELVNDVSMVGHKIKAIRSDCGLEFCNDLVRRYLLSKNIKHNTSTPRAPEQNGFIERQNRTVVESAKAMLHEKNLPIYLWAEATNTAVYLKNRTASIVLDGVTPYEKWFGIKPSVGHLRVFGCEAFVHISKDLRTKWDKNSMKCLMIGYNDDCKAYRVYDPTTKNVYIRRDVIFNEEIVDKNEIVLIDKKPEEEQTYNPDETNKTYKNSRIPIERSPYLLRSKENICNAEPEVCLAEFEPSNLEEALNCHDAKQWLEAINEEINALNKNKTWVLVPRPKDKNVITNRWVFKIKLKSDGSIDKYKARLVVKGFLQKYGFDYTEVFAPVVKYESVRMILAIAAASNLDVFQFDVKTAFLHGEIEEQIFMEQPYGFESGDKICLLKKGLYGLKQASRQWNKCFVEYLKLKNFKESTADPCVFLYENNNNTIYLALYVDDGLICGNNNSLIKHILGELHKKFEITFKNAEFFVGMQIERRDSSIKIFQSAYIKKVLERFNHLDCSTTSIPADPGIKFIKETNTKQQIFPYREAIGSLLYLVICTRPDICYIVGVLSRYVENPSVIHWQGVKQVFRYLKGTMATGIVFSIKMNKLNFNAFCDADWGGDNDTRRSTTGYICFFNNGPIAWSSKRQTITATSTTEAEFIALCAVTKTVIWLRKILKDIGHEQVEPTLIQCDNQRAITLVNNPEASNKTKHIDIQYFYTCDVIKQKHIVVTYVKSCDQLADFLTKALPKNKFNDFISRLGMRN